MAGNAGLIQAELAINVGTAIADLRVMIAELSKFGQAAGAGVKPANEAVGGFAKTLRDVRQEQAAQGRDARFLADGIASVIPVSNEAKIALRGLVGVGIEGLAGGIGIGLVIEGVKAAAEVWHYFANAAEEAAQKAAEAMGKVGDKLSDLQRRRFGTPDSQVESGKIDAARRLLAERQAAFAEAEGEGRYASGLGDSERLQNINRQIEAWEKVNGKLETYIALQGEIVSEMRMAESVRQTDAVAAAKEAGDKISALTQQQSIQAEFNASIHEAQRAFQADGNAPKLQQLITNALNARTKATRELARATLDLREAQIAATLGGYEDTRIGLSPEERARLAADAEKARLQQIEDQGRNAGGFSGFEDERLTLSFEEKMRLAKDATDQAGLYQQAWSGAIMNVAGAFDSIGTAVGGVAGSVLSMLGKMLATAVSVAIAYAAMAPPPWGAISMAAMGVGLIATIASTVAQANVQARELGGAFGSGLMLVGEGGPELLRIPAGVSGSVIPNRRLAMAGLDGPASAGALGDTINVYTFDSRSLRDYMRSNAREFRDFIRGEVAGGRL